MRSAQSTTKGWTQTSFYLKVIHFTSHYTTSHIKNFFFSLFITTTTTTTNKEPWRRSAFADQCMTSVGKRLHTLPSHLTLREPQSFSWGTQKNTQNKRQSQTTEQGSDVNLSLSQRPQTTRLPNVTWPAYSKREHRNWQFLMCHARFLFRYIRPQ